MRTVSMAWEDGPEFEASVARMLGRGTHVTVWGAPDDWRLPAPITPDDNQRAGGVAGIVENIDRQVAAFDPMRVERIGCPACGPERPPSFVHGPGCEQCEGEGWVWQVPNHLSEEEVRTQMQAIVERERAS